MKRARDQDLRGFAGEGNGVERSERHASAAKPEEHRALGYQEYTTKAGWLLGDVVLGALLPFVICRLSHDGEGVH